MQIGGQVECNWVVSANANDWSAAMQLGGQRECKRLVNGNAIRWSSEMQLRKELHELKFNIGFVQRLLLEAEGKERVIKAVIAITSSASIGAWVVWKELAVLWGAIIAGSQVLSVIYPLLPYADRLKTFSLMLKDLELLFIEAEHKWQSVADGSMYAQKIDSERTLLHKQKSKILNKYMPTSIFPENTRFADRAEQDAANYFSRYYPKEYEPSKSFGTKKEAAKDGALT